MNGFLKTMRKNNEQLIIIKERSLDGKLPVGLLEGGTAGIKDAVDHFKKIQLHDSVNE